MLMLIIIQLREHLLELHMENIKVKIIGHQDILIEVRIFTVN